MMLLEATAVVKSPSIFKTETPIIDTSLLGGGLIVPSFQVEEVGSYRDETTRRGGVEN
jgi:hypothetical protein